MFVEQVFISETVIVERVCNAMVYLTPSYSSLIFSKHTQQIVQTNMGCLCQERLMNGLMLPPAKISLVTRSHSVLHAVNAALLDTEDYLGWGRMWKVSHCI